MENNEINGYKAFYKNHKNRYGLLFEEGTTYQDEGKIEFGNSSRGGFHMCKRLEDTLRFFPGDEDNVSIAEVTGKGKIAKFEDDYEGYYDMYSVEKLTINRFLDRDEIIGHFLYDYAIDDDRVCRFIQLYKLNDEEIEEFKYKYGDSDKVMKFISYYQDNDKDAFNKGFHR